VGENVVLAAVISAVIGAALGFVLVKFLDRLRKRDAETEAREIMARAEREAVNRKKEAELEIKERAIQLKAEGERELAKSRQELHERERSLDKRQDTLEQHSEQLRRQEKMVEGTQRKLAERIEDTNRRNEELASLLDLHRQTLHLLSGLSREEATKRLLEMLEADLQHEAGSIIMRHERKLAETMDLKARDVLLTAIQRCAAAHTAETTTSTVDIPSDEMKGRIIGREGRNIRAFEKATGVDVIIDDTPGVVIVSGFDTVRREIARLSLNKLIADGRIHPTRIEEIVNETQAEMEQHIQKRGEEAGQEADVPGLHPKVIQGHSPARPAAIPHQLQPERPEAFDRGVLPGRFDRRRNGTRWRSGSPVRAAARYRQGRRS
jgi:ribonucrease Y